MEFSAIVVGRGVLCDSCGESSFPSSRLRK
ncbi:hypothetical protein CCACVL1_28898 [Corchorus capsularis]|uniref:Uncharacterized protein n=1 Tax=Corchorus capsularis TaxID=210143 RepID=A0A1R3G4U1_COCAP|nr:hypothetical protein CCACVL1_28898 [Corchorus capsularis]